MPTVNDRNKKRPRWVFGGSIPGATGLNPGHDDFSLLQSPCTALFLTSYMKYLPKVKKNKMAEEGDHEPVTENPEESEEKIEYPLIVQYCGGKKFFACCI